MKVRYKGKTDPIGLKNGKEYEVLAVVGEPKEYKWYRIALETDDDDGSGIPGYLYPEGDFEIIEGKEQLEDMCRAGDIIPQGQICPVCGEHTFELNDSDEVCPVCGWKDDRWQRENPDFEGGANKMSLNQYREAWKAGKPCK